MPKTSAPLCVAMRNDFGTFVRKVFAELNAGALPERGKYQDVMIAFGEDVAFGRVKRGIVNMPPRHLKTIVFSIALTAWMLGHNPGLRVMIVTYGDDLSRDIADKLRSVIWTAWYQEVFSTTIARERSAVTDFATTAGGQVFATSIGGAITGRGADLIIVDDPVKISDATNSAVHDSVFNTIITEVQNRLNNPAKGQILVVGHRLHQSDLSGQLMSKGGWVQLKLPFLAREATTIRWGSVAWERKAGELLRSTAYTPEMVAELEAMVGPPDFETLYQQNPAGVPWRPFTEDDFPPFEGQVSEEAPVVLSIDPAQSQNERASYWVVQAWAIHDGKYILIDQVRKKCEFEGMISGVQRMVKRHLPSLLLIEDTSTGPALRERIRRGCTARIIMIPPPRDSKLKRLQSCIGQIFARNVLLYANASFREEFLDELVSFPRSSFSDQVDAMTQFLNFMDPGPTLPRRRHRAIGVVATQSGIAHSAQQFLTTTAGAGPGLCVLGRQPRRY